MVLMAIMAIIVTVQVLPQVDLPDTAFHEDTAPVVTKFRAAGPPTLTVVSVSPQRNPIRPISTFAADVPIARLDLRSAAIPVLLCCLLC